MVRFLRMDTASSMDRPFSRLMITPTICGMIVEARDQVRITARWLLHWTASTFFISFSSTYGPFFVERDTSSYSLLVVAPPDNQLVAWLLATGPVAKGRLPPRCLPSPVADGCLALAAAVRVIARIHRRAPNLGPPPQPAVPARLAEL